MKRKSYYRMLAEANGVDPDDKPFNGGATMKTLREQWRKAGKLAKSWRSKTIN